MKFAHYFFLCTLSFSGFAKTPTHYVACPEKIIFSQFLSHEDAKDALPEILKKEGFRTRGFLERQFDEFHKPIPTQTVKPGVYSIDNSASYYDEREERFLGASGVHVVEDASQFPGPGFIASISCRYFLRYYEGKGRFSPEVLEIYKSFNEDSPYLINIRQDLFVPIPGFKYMSYREADGSYQAQWTCNAAFSSWNGHPEYCAISWAESPPR